MDLQVELDDFGKVKLATPRSLTAIYDLSIAVGRGKDPKMLARICAAFVGICWSEENEKGFPVYDLAKGDVISYGTECLEFLLKQGCSPETIMRETSPHFVPLYDELPSMKEIKAKEAFFREEGDGRSADSED